MPAETREMDVGRMSYIRHGKVLKSGGQHSVIPEYGIWSLLVSTYEIAKMSSTWQLCKALPFKFPVVGYCTLDIVSLFAFKSCVIKQCACLHDELSERRKDIHRDRWICALYSDVLRPV